MGKMKKFYIQFCGLKQHFFYRNLLTLQLYYHLEIHAREKNAKRSAAGGYGRKAYGYFSFYLRVSFTSQHPKMWVFKQRKIRAMPEVHGKRILPLSEEMQVRPWLP